jgi:hypothetical protein
MPHIDTRAAFAAALALILLAAIGLSACGGSSATSSTTSSKTSSTASAGTSSTGSTGSARSGRFAGLRECLQKQGITLPKRGASGQRAGGAGGFLGGGGEPQLPKGVTRAQLQAALQKCGGPGAGRFGGAKARLANPTFKAAFAKFATCMRGDGVKLPAPNTTGNGPVFDTHGLNTASTAFKAAAAKCIGFLRGAFPRGGAAGK